MLAPLTDTERAIIVKAMGSLRPVFTVRLESSLKTAK
jgi:hypothetical protein